MRRRKGCISSRGFTLKCPPRCDYAPLCVASLAPLPHAGGAVELSEPQASLSETGWAAVTVVSDDPTP